jgi:Tat protein secretion system quality control protein TatD with DNase activity
MNLRETLRRSRSEIKYTLRGMKSHNVICFTGDLASARQIIDTSFYLSIGGVLSYKNSGLAEVLKEIPLEHMVLETDSPYLTPVPFRVSAMKAAILNTWPKSWTK